MTISKISASMGTQCNHTEGSSGRKCGRTLLGDLKFWRSVIKLEPGSFNFLLSTFPVLLDWGLSSDVSSPERFSATTYLKYIHQPPTSVTPSHYYGFLHSTYHSLTLEYTTIYWRISSFSLWNVSSMNQGNCFILCGILVLIQIRAWVGFQ